MVERPITTNSKCKDLMIAYRRCLLMKDSKFEQKVSNIQWENFGIIFRKKNLLSSYTGLPTPLLNFTNINFTLANVAWLSDNLQ